jgi:hypothetical protein
MDQTEGCKPFGNRRLLQCIYLTSGKSKGKMKPSKPFGTYSETTLSSNDPNGGMEENGQEDLDEDITIIDSSAPHHLTGSNSPISLSEEPFVPLHAFGSDLPPAANREQWELPEDVEGWDVIDELDKEKENWDKTHGISRRIVVRNVQTGETRRAVIKDDSFEIWEPCARAIQKERQDFWEFVVRHIHLSSK